jgi:hypothetical protein
MRRGLAASARVGSGEMRSFPDRSPSRRLKSLRDKLVARLTGRRVQKRVRAIPEDLGVEGFFAELRDRQVRYAVLRWFDRLPYVRPGSDVDLLVHDDDVAKVEALLTDSGQGVRCDLYSVGGLPGTAYRAKGRELPGVSYFPSSRAKALLERAEQRGLYRVPRLEDHFLSLAYHAVYQKGPRSGLPSRHPDVVPDPSPRHDHAAILAQLSRDAGIDVAIEMEALDEYLASRGWRPAEHVIEALRPHNSWIAAHFASSER